MMGPTVQYSTFELTYVSHYYFLFLSKSLVLPTSGNSFPGAVVSAVLKLGEKTSTNNIT
jgi:hypothetical protein